MRPRLVAVAGGKYPARRLVTYLKRFGYEAKFDSAGITVTGKWGYVDTDAPSSVVIEGRRVVSERQRAPARYVGGQKLYDRPCELGKLDEWYQTRKLVGVDLEKPHGEGATPRAALRRAQAMTDVSSLDWIQTGVWDRQERRWIDSVEIDEIEEKAWTKRQERVRRSNGAQARTTG